MSVLRFLSPARRSASPSPSSSSSPTQSQTPTLAIHVPSYGSIFMDPMSSHDTDISTASTPSRSRRMDNEARGEIEITLPRGYGRKRVKGVRVWWKTVVDLYMGEERGWEDDVLFEREVVLGGEGGIVLEEGVQRYVWVTTLNMVRQLIQGVYTPCLASSLWPTVRSITDTTLSS
jgi:hypothetical protein